MLTEIKNFIGIARFPGTELLFSVCEYINNIYRGTRNSYYKDLFFVGNEQVDDHLQILNYHDDSVSL